MHGNSVGAVDGTEGEHEKVGDVGEEVGEDYEGHGGVDYAREVAGGVAKFTNDVVSLLGRRGVSLLLMWWIGKKGWEIKRGTYIIPAVECP